MTSADEAYEEDIMDRILIIDDEKRIRNGLHQSVEKLLLFDEIDEAKNGKEALLKATSKRYDIILTDIKMPDMTGLELIEKIREKNDQTRFVIISGHAEFDYAKKAIELGVSSYLLKPVTDEMLTDAIRKSVDELKENMALENKNERLLSDKNKILLEREINEIFYANNEHAFLENKVLREYGFQKERFVCLSMVYFNPYSYEQTTFLENDTNLIKYAIENVLNDISVMQKVENFFVFHDLRNTNYLFVLMTDTSGDVLKKRCKEMMTQFQQSVMQYLNIDLKIALSDTSERIEKRLYMQCKDAFCRRFVLQGQRVYVYKPQDGAENERWKADLSLLRSNIEWKEPVGILNALTRLFSEELLQNLGAQAIVTIYQAVVHTIFAVFTQLNVAGGKAHEILPNEFETLDVFDKLSQVSDYIYTVILRSLGIEKEREKEDEIELVKQYINANYANDLAVSEVAEQLHYHPSYFSTFFKKETGKSFVKYLAEVRVAKACELLLDSPYSNQKIAAMVGYHDAQYFYKVFKAIVGTTPLEYRMKNSGDM